MHDSQITNEPRTEVLGIQDAGVGARVGGRDASPCVQCVHAAWPWLCQCVRARTKLAIDVIGVRVIKSANVLSEEDKQALWDTPNNLGQRDRFL